MPRSAGGRSAGSRADLGRPSPHSGPAGRIGLIARIWRGQTRASMADEYTKYLYEEGVLTIARIPGNRGVQMLRAVSADVAVFQVLSYWDSVEAIKRFAGDDYEKVRHLPEDSKYMTGAAPTVRHFEVVVNDWPQR
jgi:heme-degrading monooxygenase HmoA